jgi:hypothetical protein
MADKDLVVRALRGLVDALDQRAAHVERLGEARIAREAAGLRKEALHRIQALRAESSDRETREADRAGGVMTDEGGPPKNEREIAGDYYPAREPPGPKALLTIRAAENAPG